MDSEGALGIIEIPLTFRSKISQVIIIDAQKNNEPIVFGPIGGGKSVIIIGDQLKSSWLKGLCATH